mmetsp:Transcript_19691/g.37023  ORF Transcript_19691/g.37023 Transcript_19691/m.37023 type:complete len:254 (+) Transcript_19691:337-1098(+)
MTLWSGTFNSAGSWCGMSPVATRLRKSSTDELRCASPSCILSAVRPVDESDRRRLARFRADAPAWPAPRRFAADAPDAERLFWMFWRRLLKFALDPPPLSPPLPPPPDLGPTLPLDSERMRLSIRDSLARPLPVLANPARFPPEFLAALAAAATAATRLFPELELLFDNAARFPPEDFAAAAAATAAARLLPEPEAASAARLLPEPEAASAAARLLPEPEFPFVAKSWFFIPALGTPWPGRPDPAPAAPPPPL